MAVALHKLRDRTRFWVGRRVWPALYTAKLRGTQHKMIITELSDPWPGDAAAGRSLIAGELDGYGEVIPLTPKLWSRIFSQHGRFWGEKAHGFAFLRDLRTVGGEQARRTGRALILGWVAQNRLWGKQVWDPAVISLRIVHWLYFYPFFMDSATPADQARFFDSLSRQVKHLEAQAYKVKRPMAALRCAKALIISAIALGEGVKQGRRRYDMGISLLNSYGTRILNPDGGPVSRNPRDLVEAMGHMIDIRMAVRKAGRDIPDDVDQWITAMAKALRFFRVGDKRLCVMNGAQEGQQEWLDQLMSLSAVAVRRLPTALSETGYMRADAGKTAVIFDVGGGDVGAAHRGQLAFELSDKTDRLVVNCGHHPFNPQWNKYMRMSAAHSTLIVGDRSSDPSIPKAVQRRDLSEGVMMESSHDGYGTHTHMRKLFLQKQGKDLRGEDRVVSHVLADANALAGDECAIRFHLHPDVDVLTGQGQVTLRARSGAGWRFTVDGADMTMEESLYLGQGAQKRQSKQIVLNFLCAVGEERSIKWAFCRL